MQVTVQCCLRAPVQSQWLLPASTDACEILGGFSCALHCWVSAAPLSSCSRFLAVPLQVIQTSVKRSEPFKMGEQYIWTHEPLSCFPDSTLSVELLERLAGVTSCNTLCNTPAPLTKLSPPLVLAGLFPPSFFSLPCMRSFPVVMPVPCVIKNCSC